MELIKEVKLPTKLYKYYGNPQYVISALQNNGIYVSNPVDFNDPFDELYKCLNIGSNTYVTTGTFQEIISYFLTNDEYIEKYWGEIDFNKVKEDILKKKYGWSIKLEDAVSEFIRLSGFDKIPPDNIVSEILNKRILPYKNINNDKVRICCFCETNKSIPMWAYYGKNHTGICVAYDTSLLKKDIGKLIHTVSYSKKRDANNVRLQKSIEWKHEKEWRIIIQKQDDELDYYPFDCISGIYFGARYSFADDIEKREYTPKAFREEKYDIYNSLISEIKKQHNKITLYKTTIDTNDFELIFTPFYEHKGGGK